MTGDQLTLSVDQAAARLGVGRWALRHAIERGEIQAIKVGRRVRIPTHVIDRLLAQGNTTTQPDNGGETPT
jgi:excisionase family DNA binding protein